VLKRDGIAGLQLWDGEDDLEAAAVAYIRGYFDDSVVE
jgi:hypothetical protein